MLLLPIAAGGQTRIRALGAIAPQVSPYWLGAEPVVDLELRTLRHIGAEQATIAGAGFWATVGPAAVCGTAFSFIPVDATLTRMKRPANTTLTKA